ncbi:hypothetical protein [Spongiactinospora rosea]|uniref:hypothetical protein n=1 Tax=Spongiactinospora rosea TaxID=2248750 RepID=UPI0011C01E3C|nr:hypothetical protein [Spongiactinospora rosea]
MREADYIFHEHLISSLHRQHIIMHEIGHILFGHHSSLWTSSGLSKLLLPDLDPELIKGMIGRAGYDNVQEREAEMFADLLSLSVSPLRRQNPAQPLAAPSKAEEVLARIEQTVGHYWESGELLA